MVKEGFRRIAFHVGSATTCEISSKLHCLPIAIFLSMTWREREIISAPPSLTSMSLNERIYQISGALEKIGAMPSPPAPPHTQIPMLIAK